MSRLWIALVVVALGAGAAVGQPAGKAKTPAALAAETDTATTRLSKDQRDRAAIVAAKAKLAKRYESELAAVYRLKQQSKSWRRERQLQDAQAVALDTSKELATLTARIAAYNGKIIADKRAVVIAVDAELPVAGAARKRALTASRAASAPPAPAPTAHKIVMPDEEIDLLADPEELDQQAQALRASELELGKQVEALDLQTKRLLKAEELRKAHERAGDLVIRDDDAPRRTGSTGGGRTTDLAGAGDQEAGPADPDAPPPMGQDLGGFHGEETAVVLSEVIDPATGDALRKAGRATDPRTKAEAAKRARDQVAARLEALRKKRAAVEARAKALRH